MIKGMLKWAIAKEDRRDGGAALHPGGHCRSLSTSSSAQSSPSIEAVANCKGSLLTLRKRRKLSHNGAHSADELETPSSGNNTRVRTTSGGTNLNQMTSLNSMTISCGVLSNHNQNHNLPCGINSNNNNNKDLNADSKSLLYMSLDHLPLAIVKQYERMLQEDEAENCHGKLGPQPGSNGPNGESQVRKAAMATGRDDSKLETKGVSMKTPKKSSMPTLPTRFKAKGGKKVILPLHNSPGISAKTVEAGNASLDVSSSTVGSVNSNSCGTKGLSSLSKFVKHGKGSKKKCKKRTPPPGSQQPGDKDASIVAQDDKAGAVGAVTTTKAASAAPLPPRCTPSPTSMSVGSGCGNEQIRHARSRSLRTSFKSSNASLNVAAGSNQDENSRPGSSTSTRRTKTNSQSTQTLQVKSILKNPLEPNRTCSDGTKNQVELNNNHAGVANQNSVDVIQEAGSSANAPPSPTASSSSRSSGTKSDPDSPAQADLSTLVHPPTPAALMKSQGAVSGGKSGVASNTIPSNLATKGVIITSGKKYEDDHDTTDPQFLETSLAYSFPVVTRRAKKLTLKRSELRKLERIRSQTDRLNRFLRKYYHECLPNLPEEEDSNCSPEEKSLAILRNYLGDDNPRFRGHGSRKNLADLLNEAAFSGIVTNSSSSLSSSGSSSSCSSSSSSDYTDWVTSTGTLRPNHHHHSRSHSRRLSHGAGGGSSGSHHHRRHRSRKLSQISGLYSAGRNILSPSNESALLPSIQEDSAEVSSASVKSTDSVKRSPRRNALRNNNSHSDRLAVKQGDLEVRNCEGAGMRIIPEDELKNRLGPDKEYLHGTFVTEGTKTDLEKLKGDEQSEQSFDHMPPTGSREECRDEMMNPLHQNHQIRISKEQVLQARLQSQHSQQDSQHLEEKPGEDAPVPQSTSSCQYYENLDCLQAQSQLQFPVQDEEDDHLYENDPRLFEQYENTRQFHADYERRLRLHDDYESHAAGFPDYENAEELSHTYANETWNSHRCHTPELFPECGDTGSIGSAGSSSSHGYGSGRSDPTTPTVIILQVEDNGNLVDGNEHHPSHVHPHHPPDLKVRAGEKEYESPREISFTPVRNETRTPPSIQGAHHQPTSNSCRTIPLSANNTGSNANYAEHETVDWNSHESPPVSPLVSSQSVIIMTEEDSGTGGFKSQVSQPSNKRNVKCVRFSRSPSVSPPPLLVEPLKSSDHQVINNNCNLNPFWKPVRGVEQHSRHDNTDPHQPRSDIDLLQQHENTHFSFQPEPLAPVNKNVGGTSKLSGIVEESEQDPSDEQDYEDEDEYENDDDDDEDEKHSSFSSDQETGECSFEATYRPANVRLMVPKLTITAPPKSPACPRASAGTTPRSLRPLSRTPLAKKSTPRKLVRKPPVKTLYTGKGEVLVRSYTNGGYVTLHVLHAKNLPTSYRSSWKLAIKISLLPEAEATFTKSESVEVDQNRSWVKIDQKFSFENSKWTRGKNCRDRKIFLTFWKRQDKKTSFLGWTTVNVASCLEADPESSSDQQDSSPRIRNQKTWQSWLKLRKRKMSGVTSNGSSYLPAAYNAMRNKEELRSRNVTKGSPLPLEIETLEEIQSPDSQEDETHSHFPHHHHPDEIKSSVFPNSATMDSGVEDCCEPTILPPSIELDETQGKRVRVKMTKEDGQGFGFSVVWVSPPRIERLEKGKTADLAGLRIGDLIIGVNGEDVTTVPNTTIYHNMKTTGNQIELEVWRKHSRGSNNSNSNMNTSSTTSHQVTNASVHQHGKADQATRPGSGGGPSPQIGSMVMMLMTGTGTPLKGAAPAGNKENGGVNTPKHQIKSTSTSGTTAPSANPPTPSHHHGSHGNHGTVPAATAATSHTNNNNNNNVNVATVSNSNNNHILPTSKYGTASGNSNENHPYPHLQNSSPALSPPVRVQPPPVSILKPPPPAPPKDEPPLSTHLVAAHHHPPSSPAPPQPPRNVILGKKVLPPHPQPTLASSSWKIRFNVEVGQGTIV